MTDNRHKISSKKVGEAGDLGPFVADVTQEQTMIKRNHHSEALAATDLSPDSKDAVETKLLCNQIK